MLKFLTLKTAFLAGGGVLLLATAGFAYALFRPLTHPPRPAPVRCLDEADGDFAPWSGRPANIYGVGLAYANHINETASDFDPAGPPPIFQKLPRTLIRTGAAVRVPTAAELIADIDAFEPGLGNQLRERYGDLPHLLDYETELAFVVLEDITPQALENPAFAPRIGFLMANDVTARSLAVLGEGRPNRSEYWGVAKSFAGFLPVADRIWIPREPGLATIPCIRIETIVNGELRQNESTANLIYTPAQMLRFIHQKYPNQPLRKGDLILTGTPGGVALATPRWLGRLGNLFGLNRFQKLSAILRKDRSAFLKPGDRVTVRGEWLGDITNTIQ